MSHDLLAQLLGPLVLVNIDGMSRCQHQILNGFIDQRRSTVSIRELHDASVARRDWSDLQAVAKRLLQSNGFTFVPSLSLSVRLHALAIEAQAILGSPASAVRAVRTQLESELKLLRRGVISEAQLAISRIGLQLSTTQFAR